MSVEAERDGICRLCPSPKCVCENLNLKDVTYRLSAENLEIHWEELVCRTDCERRASGQQARHQGAARVHTALTHSLIMIHSDAIDLVFTASEDRVESVRSVSIWTNWSAKLNWAFSGIAAWKGKREAWITLRTSDDWLFLLLGGRYTGSYHTWFIAGSSIDFKIWDTPRQDGKKHDLKRPPMLYLEM